MIITCLEELEKRKTLQISDIVIFTVKEKMIRYVVYLRFLNTSKEEHKSDFIDTFNYVEKLPCDNSIIFKILEINERKIAAEAYGYEASNGEWPESRNNDFAALTRLTKKLYEIKMKKFFKYTPFNRFEIMEL